MPAASLSTGLAQWLTMKIWSGKAAATRANSSACCGIDHRLQMQPVPADGADAREPPRILHQIGARGEPLGRVGVPAEPGAYADHAIIAGLRGDGRFGAGGFQRHGGDAAVGDAVRLVQRLQPSRFLQRRRRVPAGLDVHGGDHVLPGGVGAIVPRQIVAPDRAEIAERVRIARIEPRMPPHRQIPQMNVSVDDGSPVECVVHVSNFSASGKAPRHVHQHARRAGDFRDGYELVRRMGLIDTAGAKDDRRDSGARHHGRI